jgi:hypothetical protein
MDWLTKFVRDSGGWGLTSEIAAFVLFGFAVWEHTQDKPVTAFAMLAISVPLFWAGALVAWKKEFDAVEHYRKIFSTMPRLRPAEFYANSVIYQYGDGSMPPRRVGSSVHLKIRNDPQFPVPEANAKGVSAKITFYDSQNSELFTFDARWSDTDQPSSRAQLQSKFDLLCVDIPIGQTREIDIAMKYPDETDAYGFNNDSYFCSQYQNPQWKLVGEDFTVEVRVRGTYIDKIWRMRFKNTAKELKPEGAVVETRDFLTYN